LRALQLAVEQEHLSRRWAATTSVKRAVTGQLERFDEPKRELFASAFLGGTDARRATVRTRAALDESVRAPE
jgi:hypothetical protein